MNNYEIIISYEGEKPTLPAGLEYMAYPGHTYQPPKTEKVFEGHVKRERANSLFEQLKNTSGIIRVDLFSNANKVRSWTGVTQ